MIWIVLIILIISNYAYVDDISCNNYLLDYCNHNILNYGNDVKLTFIIPTIGRDSLIDTVRSLLHQNNDQWKAIVIFDGIEPTIGSNDKRITIIKSDKKLGEHVNSAGNVRNYGIQFATTEWIAFVDDDDSISNDYVDIFYWEIKNKSYIEILLFRMLDDGKVKPNLNLLDGDLQLQDVGISFAVKKTIFDQGLEFIASPLEDFNFLNNCVKAGYVLVISPYITYYVRQYKLGVMASSESLGNRLIFRINVYSNRR